MYVEDGQDKKRSSGLATCGKGFVVETEPKTHQKIDPGNESWDEEVW